MVQVGGIGVITWATLLGLQIARRVGLRLNSSRGRAEASGWEVRRRWSPALSLAVEAAGRDPAGAAVRGALRQAGGAGTLPGRVPLGVGVQQRRFHAVHRQPDRVRDRSVDLRSAGRRRSLVGVGFPVLFELGRRLRGGSRRWSLHLKITIGTYAVLLALRVATFLTAEWRNPDTIGPLSVGGKLVAGCFQGVMPLTAGFNGVEVGQMYPATLLVTDVLMFIGGGSAGTAGGIKVTTFALLAFVMLAEARGRATVQMLGRRLPVAVQRQALTLALSGIGLVIVSTMTLLAISPFGLDAVLFEAVSAFGTAGLTTETTDDLPIGGQLVLTALMFLGRPGPITLASALALREHPRCWGWTATRRSCSASPTSSPWLAAVADTTDVEALRQRGVPEFSRAVVAIGIGLEARILTAAVLSDLGIPQIWAKAASRQHGRILERVGAHHVVLPEHEMRERVAHLVGGRRNGLHRVEDDYAMVKTAPPPEIIGIPLSRSGVRSRYGVTVWIWTDVSGRETHCELQNVLVSALRTLLHTEEVTHQGIPPGGRDHEVSMWSAHGKHAVTTLA